MIDDDNSGIITKTFRKIYLQNDTLSLNYYLNTTIFQEMSSNKFFMEACKQTKILMPKSKQMIRNENKTFELKCHFIEKLKKLYSETITYNTTEKCEEIQNLIFRFDIVLKRLKNTNITMISDTIPINDLMYTVRNLTTIGNNKLILPFQFNNNFTKDFFNTTKMILFKTIDKVQISFRIPIYTEINLFNLFPKPFLADNKPYIYNLGQAYYTKTPNLTIFTNNSYKRNCFYSKNQKRVFCKNATKIRQCDQNMLLHNIIELDSNCFTKLPLTNFVTQYMFNFDFTIRTPLDNITCSNKTEQLHLVKSIDILQVYNCTLQTKNVKLFSNKTDQYGIYALPSKSDHTPSIILRYFFIFVLLLFFIPNLIYITVMAFGTFFLLPESNDNSTYVAFASTILEINKSTPNCKESSV